MLSDSNVPRDLTTLNEASNNSQSYGSLLKSFSPAKAKLQKARLLPHVRESAIILTSGTSLEILKPWVHVSNKTCYKLQETFLNLQSNMQWMLFKKKKRWMLYRLTKALTDYFFPLQSEPNVSCSSSLKYQTTSLKSVENQTRLRFAAMKPQNVVEKFFLNTECGHSICKSDKTLRNTRITSRISNYLKYKLYRI